MECCTRFRADPFLDPSPKLNRPKPDRLRHRPALKNLPSFKGTDKLNFSSSVGGSSRALSLITLAATGEYNDEFESRSVGTPLEPRSPEGKFLCGILKNHPHIFPVAVEEQLEELAGNRDSAFARWEHSAGSEESCLHGRIAEMKEQECQFAVEEVMYLSIVHNFFKIKVPMIPNLWKCTSNGKLEIWSSKDEELESIHGPEVLEVVREHLSNILRWKVKSESVINGSTLEIKRLHIARVYAASIMYGYFLKSVTLRHRLELSFPSVHLPIPRFEKNTRKGNFTTSNFSTDTTSSLLYPSNRRGKTESPSASRGGKTEKLRGYMMRFDAKALKLCAKIRSQEAVNLIENHSWALFGDPDKKNTEDDDAMVAVSVTGLKRLVLEAVAFGCFLWDVEGYVDSVYRLKEN